MAGNKIKWKIVFKKHGKGGEGIAGIESCISCELSLIDIDSSRYSMTCQYISHIFIHMYIYIHIHTHIYIHIYISIYFSFRCTETNAPCEPWVLAAPITSAAHACNEPLLHSPNAFRSVAELQRLAHERNVMVSCRLKRDPNIDPLYMTYRCKIKSYILCTCAHIYPHAVHLCTYYYLYVCISVWSYTDLWCCMGWLPGGSCWIWLEVASIRLLCLPWGCWCELADCELFNKNIVKMKESRVHVAFQWRLLIPNPLNS
jgi:hypothetical protein